VMRMRKLAVDSCAAVQVWPHASPVDPSVYVATVVPERVSDFATVHVAAIPQQFKAQDVGATVVAHARVGADGDPVDGAHARRSAEGAAQEAMPVSTAFRR
jgi:hypothetical protein